MLNLLDFIEVLSSNLVCLEGCIQVFLLLSHFKQLLFGFNFGLVV